MTENVRKGRPACPWQKVYRRFGALKRLARKSSPRRHGPARLLLSSMDGPTRFLRLLQVPAARRTEDHWFAFDRSALWRKRNRLHRRGRGPRVVHCNAWRGRIVASKRTTWRPDDGPFAGR